MRCLSKYYQVSQWGLTKDHDYWSWFSILECAWFSVILVMIDRGIYVRLDIGLACGSGQLIN